MPPVLGAPDGAGDPMRQAHENTERLAPVPALKEKSPRVIRVPHWATASGSASDPLSGLPPAGTARRKTALPMAEDVRSTATVRDVRGPDDFAAAFDVSRETIARLETYEKLLRHWQSAVNLVSPATLDVVWLRHFADSAQLVGILPAARRRWIDLGSGGGFPGLVIAILLAGRAASPAIPAEEGDGSSPLSRVTLIESDTRKAAFLREVVRQCAFEGAVAVEILSTRAESVRIKVNGSLPRVICARALAPLDRLFEFAAPLSPPGTTGLYLKGKGVAEELHAAEKSWKFNVELVPSVTSHDGRVVVITNLERKAKD